MMTIKSRLLVFCMTVVAGHVLAVDRTWVGNGGDVNWQTPGNWNGESSAPGDGDSLFFGGTSKLVNSNDFTDATFAGITFNSGAGAFTLNGNPFTLTGDVVTYDFDMQTLNLPMALSETRTFNATNGALSVSGVLSGTGGLTKAGTNSLTLSANNSYEGVTTVNKGVLAITHGNALGSTNAYTVVDNAGRGTLQLSGNITVHEPLALNGDRPDYASTLYNASGSNTLSGPISKTHSVRLSNGNSGATLVVAGGVQQVSGGADLVLNPNGGTVLITTTPLNLGTGSLYFDQGGTVLIAVASNSWAGIRAAGGTMRTDIANALPATSTLYVGVWYSPSGTFNLNGFDQTIGALVTDTTVTGTRTVTSPTRATLTVNQTGNTTYNGLLAGAVRLVKTGTGQLLFTNAVSTTTGDLIVSNGTLVVENTAGFSSSTNVVVAGGTLELRTATSLPDSANLSIASGGAKVRIKTGLTETVSRLFLDGVPQLHGSYGGSGSGAAHISTYFDGTGVLYVANGPLITPTSFTWNAGGGANTDLSTAANWEGSLLPDFAGTSHVFFASAGSTATVDTNANLYGLTFNRAGNFALANGTGALTLGAGGITAASPAATTNTYTLAEDVTLMENQTWCVTNNSSGTTLAISGKIGAGTDLVNITKTGNGTLVLSGSNTFDGVVSNGLGVITVSHPNALGSAAKGTVINAATRAQLEIKGSITLAEPLTIVGNTSAGTHLLSSSGSNTITGPITTWNARYSNAGPFLNIAGGVTGYGDFVINNSGIFAFTATPVNLGTSTLWSDQGGTVVLGVASNVWGTTMIATGTLRTDIPNALPTNTVLRIGGISWAPTGKVNLNGCAQTVAGLSRHELTPGTIVVTSALPATLTVNLNTAMKYDGQLDGALGLVKAGTGTLTLSNALSNTRGDMTVSNGTLLVTAASKLGNSTNITVAVPASGTSTLTLQSSTALADAATLSIANGGAAKVSLATGVNETVSWLYFGDKMQRAGTYSAASGPGVLVVDTEHFAGTGILTVLHDKSGTLIRLQ